MNINTAKLKIRQLVIDYFRQKTPKFFSMKLDVPNEGDRIILSVWFSHGKENKRFFITRDFPLAEMRVFDNEVVYGLILKERVGEMIENIDRFTTTANLIDSCFESQEAN